MGKLRKLINEIEVASGITSVGGIGGQGDDSSSGDRDSQGSEGGDNNSLEEIFVVKINDEVVGVFKESGNARKWRSLIIMLYKHLKVDKLPVIKVWRVAKGRMQRYLNLVKTIEGRRFVGLSAGIIDDIYDVSSKK